MSLVQARLNDFVVVFISIVLQSLPFVLIGVFAAALVQQYLSERVVLRWMPRRRLTAVMAASLFGLVAPVCDCGAIPLGRRLASKGVPRFAALTFMLAAPVVNPVTLLATAVAFQGSWAIVLLRAGMTLGAAVVVGLAAAALEPVDSVPGPLPAPIRGGSLDEPSTGLLRLVARANAEFFEVIFFIILGALFTAATQAFVPRGDLTAFGGHPILSVLTLMPVATILSICSEADAFVARAFAGTFSLGAIMAFMTIGQLVDLRNAALLLRAVGPRLLLLVVGLSYLVVLVEALAINAVRPAL